MPSYQIRTIEPASRKSRILFTMMDSTFDMALKMAQNARLQVDNPVAIYSTAIGNPGSFDYCEELWCSE